MIIRFANDKTFLQTSNDTFIFLPWQKTLSFLIFYVFVQGNNTQQVFPYL